MRHHRDQDTRTPGHQDQVTMAKQKTPFVNAVDHRRTSRDVGNVARGIAISSIAALELFNRVESHAGAGASAGARAATRAGIMRNA